MKSNSKEILEIELTLALDGFQSSCSHLIEIINRVKINNSSDSENVHFLNLFNEGLKECINLSEVDRDEIVFMIYNPQKSYICLVCQAKGYTLNLFGIKVRCQECEGKGMISQ